MCLFVASPACCFATASIDIPFNVTFLHLLFSACIRSVALSSVPLLAGQGEAIWPVKILLGTIIQPVHLQTRTQTGFSVPVGFHFYFFLLIFSYESLW